MILQALTDYYRVLEQAGKIDAPGWAPAFWQIPPAR